MSANPKRKHSVPFRTPVRAFAGIPATSLGLKHTAATDLADQVSDGLSIASWDNFIRYSGLSADEVSEVVMLPRRTLSRRRDAGRLDPVESDRLMRFSMLVDAAVKLFEGDVNAARQWLRAAQPALGGRTPIGFAKTTVGSREVEDLIGRLDRGVYT